jgi:hypothetical protein
MSDDDGHKPKRTNEPGEAVPRVLICGASGHAQELELVMAWLHACVSSVRTRAHADYVVKHVPAVVALMAWRSFVRGEA